MWKWVLIILLFGFCQRPVVENNLGFRSTLIRKSRIIFASDRDNLDRVLESYSGRILKIDTVSEIVGDTVYYIKFRD